MSVVCHRRIENIKKIKLKRVLFHRHGLIVFMGKFMLLVFKLWPFGNYTF